MAVSPLLRCAGALVVRRLPWRAGALAAWALAAVLAATGLAGCQPGADAGPRYGAAPRPGPPVYRLAVHPLHNPRKLMAAYGPLVDYLNRHVAGASFELEASRDYAAYEAKFRGRGPELLLPNPWQALQAIGAGYRVIAMAGDADDFRGLFIVRRDSPLARPADLRGRAVAYPAPTAVAACLLPQWFLHQQGVDVVHAVDNRYVGSQESAILGALSGDVAAAATWPPPWRAFQKDHPEQAAQLRVLWQTPPLVNNAVMVRDDLPAALRLQLGGLLTSLHETPEGRAVLAAMETHRILPADDARYEVVRRFVERFEREVRPVGSS